MPWSGEYRGFIVEAFFKHGESVTATQRAFRTRFGLRANESVPDRKTILLWVQRVRATGSALKRMPICGVAMKPISTFQAQWTNKIYATGLLKTLENSMHDLFTAQKWPVGVLCRL
jgi:hypothetical protein